MPKPPYDLADGLVDALDLNQRTNRLLLEATADEAWSADPPGGKGRTIAAIVSHVQNVRCMWLKGLDARVAALGKVDRRTITREVALEGLELTHGALRQAVSAAARGDGRIRDFPRGVAAFVGYMIAHDTHHRGQICALLRQLGHRLPDRVTMAMWEWGKGKVAAK